MLSVSYTLVERNGILCAKETFVDIFEPRIVANWFELTISMAEFATWFATPEMMRERLGSALFPVIARPVAVWKDVWGWTYRLPTGLSGERISACVEIVSIPEPAQQGRRYPLQWHEGAWHKETKKGLVKLAL